VLPWQFNESFPNAWCTSALDWQGDAKPVYYGVARAYRGAASAQFATCAWGGRDEVRASVSGPAQLVDLDGRVVAQSGGGEISAPLDAFAYDVFVLDVEGNRYVMSRTSDLAPLLTLPRAELHAGRDGDGLVLTHVGGPAALGIVVEDARPVDEPGWVTFSDNVIDLLPGEERRIEVRGPVAELLVEGWNARV
jgi:beta-mannosidase